MTQPKETRMTAATTHELDVDTARLVTHLSDLNAKIADLSSEAESVKAELRHLAAGDHTIDGRAALRVTLTRRFDPVAGLLLVPEQLRPDCYTQIVDPVKVKSYLAPALVDTAMVISGKPSVKIL